MRTWGKVVLTFCRNFKTPRLWKEDAARSALVTYYPRHKDFKDPEFTPTKLLMVQRVKPYKGNPYWQKAILDSLGLGEDEKKSKYAIVKNTPEMCASLWVIKHIVQISQVELPEMEINENIIDRVWLHENGRVAQVPKVDPVRYEAAVKYANDKKKLKPLDIEPKLRQIWLDGNVP